MNNELPEVQMISKYIPDFRNLELNEIRQLSYALQAVIKVLSIRKRH